MEAKVLGKFSDSAVVEVGRDINKYVPYYEESLEYLMPGEDRYRLVVDEDVRALGLSNRQVETLGRCISLLEQGKETERAKRILQRYTYESFNNAKQWREWYQKNHKRLFFSEVNNYKFDLAPVDLDLARTQGRAIKVEREGG